LPACLIERSRYWYYTQALDLGGEVAKLQVSNQGGEVAKLQASNQGGEVAKVQASNQGGEVAKVQAPETEPHRAACTVATDKEKWLP